MVAGMCEQAPERTATGRCLNSAYFHLSRRAGISILMSER